MTAAERIRFDQMPLLSRIAPTPSGYLHLGNVVNFIITFGFWLAGAVLRLRSDDIDGTRCSAAICGVCSRNGNNRTLSFT